MKASDLFLKCLELQGVESIYGVPGEENADLMISLLESPIEFITCTHEQTAAFMACMHGALSGVPGVCLATLGPGASNLTTGVAQAQLDGSPLVAIIGQADTDRLHKASHQNINSIDMFKPITKWAATILSADTIPEVLAKAFKIACSGRPGAVVIELPEDIAKESSSEEPIVVLKEHDAYEAAVVDIEVFLKLLRGSRKPLLLIGDGAVRAHSDRPIRTFLEKTGLYVAYTFMGKGVVSHQYERSLHCVGLGLRDIVIEAFEEADLVIAIGYHFVEWMPVAWNCGVKKNIIHIDSVPAEIDAHYLPIMEIVGNISCIMDQLNLHLSEKERRTEAYFSKIQKKVQADLRADAEDDGFPMKPKRILKDIRDTLKDSDILVSDVGAHKMWIARQYGARESKTCFISNGFCSMGGSMPGAMEAKRIYPDKHVLAVCGDGGFMMSIQALFTGVALQIPFVVIIWDDHQYGLIRWKQEMQYQEHAYTELKHADLAEIARAIGCHARQVQSTQEFKALLQWALSNQDKPTVLVVPVDYTENMKLFLHLKGQ